jgi:uncharacterized protein YndB with AHSA1/START domain
MIEPIRVIVELDCPAEHAFEVWTARIGTWWPVDHTATGQPGVAVILEGRPGGRIFDRTPAGGEHDWGEVLAWEPPARLVYSWHLQRDRADATEVEIRFVRVERSRTRVEIEHRAWVRLGADGKAWRDRNRGGWSTLLPHYRKAAESAG